MTEHIDIEVLADYAEALLDRAASARVSRHLDECASCAGRLTELGDVSVYLSALPPPPMPPDVATRIETAIANEARVRSSLSAPAGADVIPFRSRSRRWIAPLTVAAAAVVVVGAGYGIMRQVTGGSDSTGSVPARTSTATTQELPKAAPPSMMHSGTHYTTAALGTQVNSMMEKSKSGSVEARPKTGRESPPPSMPADLAACVDRITTKVGTGPLLVDSGTYEGRPVKVLVFRKAAMPSRYDVWIVGAGCSATSDGVVSHATVARHP